MKPARLSLSWRALLIGGALIAAVPAVRLAADTPGGSAVPRSHEADVEAQLESARKNLEQAARDVARLSSELSIHVIDQMMPLVAPGHSILGLQLEPSPDGSGARVREVSPGGPAAEAGIRSGDIVVAVNGRTLAGAQPSRQVLDIMRDVKPDARVTVRVLREGKPRDFAVIARASPAIFATTRGIDLPALPELQSAFMFHRPLMDLELVTVTPALGSYFGTDKGVLVVRAPADGVLQLQDGDVILAIDGRQPTSGSHATRILSSYQPGEKVTLRVLRQHRTMELESTLPERTPLQRQRMDRVHPDMPESSVQPRTAVVFGHDEA